MHIQRKGLDLGQDTAVFVEVLPAGLNYGYLIIIEVWNSLQQEI